jgi:hypothetical protein
MNLRSQAHRIIHVLQRLDILPTRQRVHSSHSLNINYACSNPSARIPIDRALHVHGLELAAFHDDLSACGAGVLRNVQAVVIILREAERDCNVG